MYVTLMAIAVAMLAVAGLDQGGPRARDLDGTPARDQCAAPPAPGPELPGLVAGVARSSETVQSIPAGTGHRRHAHPGDVTITVGLAPPCAPSVARRPSTFPLLI